MHLLAGKIWKAGHASFAAFEGGGDLRHRHAMVQSDQRRNFGWRAGHLLSVTDGALIHVERLRSVLLGVLGEGAGPGQIVGIDVEAARLRIGGWTTPFRAAVESGEDDGVFADAEGNELAFAAEGAELFERPLMDFGSAISEEIVGEELTREWCRLRRQALLFRGDFSGNVAGRVVAAIEGEKRIAVGAIEEKYESLLGGLGDGVYFLAVALHGEQDGRRW